MTGDDRRRDFHKLYKQLIRQANLVDVDTASMLLMAHNMEGTVFMLHYRHGVICKQTGSLVVGRPSPFNPPFQVYGGPGEGG